MRKKKEGPRTYTKPVTKILVKEWSEEELDFLRAKAKEGFAASKIAVWMGRTRSGVCGKAARIGVTFANRPGSGLSPASIMKPQKAYNRIEKVKKEPVVKMAVVKKPPPRKVGEPMSLHLDLKDMEVGQCKYPDRGSSSPFLFCGNPVSGKGDWCPYHRSIVYTKTPVRSPYTNGVVRPSYRP